MKSKISSCKAAAFRKDITRFWPVWAGYILCLIVLQILQTNDDLSYWYAANMGEAISLMGVVNLCYGFVAAAVLFGDLFNSRLCNGIHGLPLKREHWFSAHMKAALLFSLVPTALMTAFSEIIIVLHSNMVDGWQVPLYWFVAANLQFLFFFGLAVFCAMCAGSRFGALVVYGILNFFSILIYLLVDQLYTPLLKGVTTMSGPFELLCPVWQIINKRCLDFERVETGKTYIGDRGIEMREYIAQFEVVPEGWLYIAVIAVLGLLLLLLARQIYKKRNLECAGDFLAVRWLEAPFQVVFTVLCAAGFQGIFMVFFGYSDQTVYILPVIGLIVGWFGGRMLLERSTRVFRVKNFVGFGLITAVMAASLYVTYLDPMGIETWIPKVGETRSATLRMNYRNGYTTEVPAEIADLTRLHALALEQDLTMHPDYDDFYYNPDYNGHNAVQIILQYTAPNGWLSQRNYYVEAEGESAEIIKKYTSRLDVLFDSRDVQDVEDLRHEFKDSKEIRVNGNHQIPKEYLTDAFCTALADAIAADAEAGNLVQCGVFHRKPIVDVEDPNYDQYSLMLDVHGTDSWSSLYIYADCENILEVLEPTGVLEAVRQEYENAYG